MFDGELVLATLGGLPPIWETFITTTSNNDKFPTFDELVDKSTHEETRMISRGRNQKNKQGEPFAVSIQDKKWKGKKDHIIQEILLLNPKTLIEV